ncbi:hypothetical protein FGADI_7852 [Fusarium gaditjirri]|uniref:Uncharacterized protein n=1 Tax=Fusarium gaditjirri TaxID=282569 RepID=A0A8H4T463_9HYPO|nr:hypothetical protein FGADI_7852 [Fusarium gaditjirri]
MALNTGGPFKETGLLQSPRGARSTQDKQMQTKKTQDGYMMTQNDDIPPLRPRVTPSPQLSVRKTRQTRPQLGGQMGQGNTFSASESSEFPGVYDLRRPVKVRTPLTNIYDRTFMSNAELPRAPHATSQEEESPLSRRSPLAAPTESSKILPRPRLERWPAPQITITPEATAIEEGCHTFWVAIEVSVRRWPESAMKIQPETRQEQLDLFTDLAGLRQRDQETGDICDNGGLNDLDVQILPTEESSVIRTLQDQPFPIRRLDPGSSVFLLAQVQVHVSKGMRRCRQKYSRLESDNLIEALKEELGDSTVSYMTVRLSYRSSAFSMCQDMGIVEDDMFSTHSKIETVVTASVKLHNAMSLWSPPPVSRSNPLLPLVERHWGVTNARKVMAQIAAEKHGPEQTYCLQQKHPEKTVYSTHAEPAWNHSPSPRIPLRKASLQRGCIEVDLDDRETHSQSHQRLIQGPSRCGSYASSYLSRQSREGLPGPRTIRGAGVNNSAHTRPKEEHTRDGSDILATRSRRTFSGKSDSSTLWKRRSLGADTLRGLFPLMAGLSITTREREVEEPRAASPARSRGKKDTSGWGWAAWF